MSFPVFGHFGDVIVDGRSVGSTSSFEFWVGREVNRLTCSGVLLVTAYFWSGDLLKIGKIIFHWKFGASYFLNPYSYWVAVRGESYSGDPLTTHQI